MNRSQVGGRNQQWVLGGGRSEAAGSGAVGLRAECDMDVAVGGGVRVHVDPILWCCVVSRPLQSPPQHGAGRPTVNAVAAV